MEHRNNKVSIIVPVYNTEQYLDRCVLSLVNQTHTNLEILLLDDGSTDNSWAVCQKFADDDKRVIAVHHSNHGVSYTRNCGLDLSTGDYITFVDSDDWVEPNYVEMLLKQACENNTQIAMCGYCVDTESGESKHWASFDHKLLVAEEVLDPFSMYFHGGVCSKLYNCELINGYRKIRFDVDIRIGEDRLFWFESVLSAKQISVSSTSLYHYTVNNAGAMKSMTFSGAYSDFLSRRKIVDLVSDYPALRKKNELSCTNVAVKAIMATDCPEKDQRFYSLKEYVNKHLASFAVCEAFTIKERLRAVLMMQKIGRVLLRLKKQTEI